MDAGHEGLSTPARTRPACPFDGVGQGQKILVCIESCIAALGEIPVSFVECGSEGDEFFRANGFIFLQPMEKRHAISRRKVCDSSLDFGDGGHGEKHEWSWS